MRFYRKGSFLFTLLVFIFVSILLFLSFGYDETTRLVPLVILIPTLIMTVFVLIGEFSPRLLRLADAGLIDVKREGMEAGASVSRGGKLIGRKGLLIVTGWLIGVSILVFLVGFVIAIPVGLFLFFKVFGDQSWFKSIVFTVVTWALLYGVFDVLMKFKLFRGILFGEIVIF